MSDLDQAREDEQYADQMREVLRRRAASLAEKQTEASTTESVGLLLFRLGEEWYAVGIGGVREIYNDYEVTRIPRVPDYIFGVFNVRGEIISVTDIGALMRVPNREVQAEGELPSAIIISNEECVTAIVVDEIGDIIDAPSDSIEPPLSTLDKAQAEYVSGSVYVDSRLVGIVNLDKILEPIGDSV